MRNALEIAIELSNIVQAKFERTGEDYKDLIEEEKKKCLGVDQNNQSTKKQIREYYNTGGKINETI